MANTLIESYVDFLHFMEKECQKSSIEMILTLIIFSVSIDLFIMYRLSFTRYFLFIMYSIYFFILYFFIHLFFMIYYLLYFYFLFKIIFMYYYYYYLLSEN